MEAVLSPAIRVGYTATRILATLLHEMARHGLKLGLASLSVCWWREGPGYGCREVLMERDIKKGG